MAGNGSYAGERPLSSAGEVEYANDPAWGGFFATDFKKHEDLKLMLDGNKDGLKLEAMKRIIGMVAKGKDASDLFPAVVKNVVSKNIEVKKLVYVYLVRFAEEQQDLALLSISTFQRALKDPNQLIRASALRVLSSIRVAVIVPIMMLSIKDSANDMSPYVRKTAAHAIPKLYSLDPEQRDQLIEVIEKLLSDKTTLVVGSAVMAFEEVCPERIDLIHKNYRKLCNLLVDVEEWGQVIIIHMLTRYSRTQFTDPNKMGGYHESQDDKNFYESDGSHDDKGGIEPKPYVMDPDHRLLLRNCKPLLQSRNAAVVMAVARLYYYVAPKNEITFIAKALIRLLHNHREVQSVVLSNIATISTKNKGIFEPYLKNFFVRSSDPTHIKLLKLEVLTNLATETNISIILREFQTYVCSSDMEFVAATIQAIGRCASSINEVTDTCLNGLVLLLSNRNETVVAESVVVIKKLLQMQPSEYKSIIVHMAKLVDSIAVPMARASILWLLGEYADRVSKIAPDVLRKMAKTFINEEDIVKLQTLNLASKLFLTNPKQTKLLTQYVFSVAKYDQNYDIRDRARFLKQLIMPQGESNFLSKHAKKVLLANKPAPLLQSKFKDRDQFQLGSLSHFINSQASGYNELPAFPEVAPDPSVRNVEVTMPWQETRVVKKKKQLVKKSSFYSETESSSPDRSDNSGTSEEDDSEAESNSGDSSQESSSEEGSGESGLDSDESTPESDYSERNTKPKKTEMLKKPPRKSKSSESGSSEEESSSQSSDEESESSKDDTNANRKRPTTVKPPSNLDLLLDLDADTTQAPVLQATTVSAVPLAPFVDNLPKSSFLQLSHPAFIPTLQHELLNRFNGNGLIATYRFTRGVNIFSSKMTTIELTFCNDSGDDIKGIHVPDKKMGNIEVKGFPVLKVLAANASALATIGIDYNESANPATLEIKTEKQTFKATIKAPVGELLQPVLMSEEEFLSHQNKLKGMNECISQVDLTVGNNGTKVLVSKVNEAANIMQVSTMEENANLLRFSGQTMISKSLVLVTLQVLNSGKVSICVNCEKIILATVLMKELKEHFSK